MDELLEKASKGDENAFAALINQCAPGMYRIAYVYLKNEADALDAVQEASYRAFRNLRSLKNSEYFRTWVMRIAINCALDILRSEKRRTAAAKADENIPGHEEGVVDRLALQTLMDELGSVEKTVLLLKACGDCTFAEIAWQLRRPEGTIKTIYYRAAKKLRISAEEAGFDE